MTRDKPPKDNVQSRAEQSRAEQSRALRIGLIDVDGHNFPNLPLMKLSAWHKARGDTVEWYSPMFSGHMDRVYIGTTNTTSMLTKSSGAVLVTA